MLHGCAFLVGFCGLVRGIGSCTCNGDMSFSIERWNHFRSKQTLGIHFS